MSKFTVVKNIVTSKAGRSLLKIKGASPEILVTVGIVGVVVSTVMACKATTKAEIALDEAKESLDKVHIVREMDLETYSDLDYRKDIAIVYTQTGVKFLRIYGPAISLGLASVGCILGAHHILKKRNVALMAAYKALETGFNDYRKRVVEEYGVEKDRELRYGTEKVKVTTIDENGVEKTETVSTMKESVYARMFKDYDETDGSGSRNWSPTPEYNLMHLRAQQNYANDILNARGHIFLNEVYDMLGMKRSPAGAVVGWVKDNADGDGFVNFGIFSGPNCQTYVNEYENQWMLDFNVDGVIWDII